VASAKAGGRQRVANETVTNAIAVCRRGTRGTRLARLLICILLLPVVSSCSLNVAANGPSATAAIGTSTPVSVSAPGGSWHDLALMSLDFDPPLKPGEMLHIDRPPILLAAVDNKGNQTEKAVIVKLRITGNNDSDPIFTDKQTISSLAQGEAKVVRFDRITSMPHRSAYTVRVEVVPVDGEMNTADNVKEIRVQIVAGGER